MEWKKKRSYWQSWILIYILWPNGSDGYNKTLQRLKMFSRKEKEIKKFKSWLQRTTFKRRK